MTRFLDILSTFLRGRAKSERPALSRERRALRRLDCRLQVDCSHRALSLHATVQDLNMGGLHMTLPFEVLPGSILAVHERPGSTTRGLRVRVMWCRTYAGLRGHEVGARFLERPGTLENAWVGRVLANRTARPTDDRGYFRAPVLAPCNLDVFRPSHCREIRGFLVNLSSTGCLIDSRCEIPAGEPIVVTLQGSGSHEIRLRGRVVRRSPGRDCSSVGIAFESLENEMAEQLDLLVSRLSRFPAPRL